MKYRKINKGNSSLNNNRKLQGQQVFSEMAETMGYESIDLLSPEHESFCWHYATHGNGRAAYQYAYPNASSRTARAEACRILALPSVSGRLDAIRAEMNNRHLDSADDIIRYFSTVMRFDRAELLSEFGKLKGLNELPMDIASVLDIDVQLHKSGVQIPVLKVPCRGSAASELARIHGLFKDILHLSGDIAQMSEEEMRAELVKLAKETLADV